MTFVTGGERGQPLFPADTGVSGFLSNIVREFRGQQHSSICSHDSVTSLKTAKLINTFTDKVPKTKDVL